MKSSLAVLCLASALAASSAPAASAPSVTLDPVESLTLESALHIADQHAPELAEARAQVEATLGRARQAGALPNPEIILGAQQLPLNGPDQREYVAGIAQTLPLTGRLGRARQAELLDREVRAQGLEVQRRALHQRVHGAFATALFQDQACAARQDLVHNAERLAALTRARVEAGDAVPGDSARVEVELARARAEARRAGALRDQALAALAAAMGDATFRIASLSGSLDAAFELPSLEHLTANLAALPENTQAQAEVRAQTARAAAASAERIPDVRLEVLYHRLDASDSDTLDVGLSVPLPLFNRHQGRLQETQAGIAAAEARARLTANEMARRLREAHLQLSTALEASALARKEVLPRMETVLKGAEARYAAGDTSLSDLLPVRRDWAAARLDHLESVRDVMQAWVALKPYLPSATQK